MTQIEKITALMQEHGMSGAALMRALGLSRGTWTQWNQSQTKPKPANLKKIAELFNVSVKDLLDDSNDAPTIAEKYITFPVIGEVAAGYNHVAYEDWSGNIDIPPSWLNGKEASDYFVLRVCGDSMFPTYQDGDSVLVLKQSVADYSGQVVVVLYNDEQTTLKRIEYDQDGNWIRLVPINSLYPPITFKGEELDHCVILGIPKKLIRNIDK